VKPLGQINVIPFIDIMLVLLAVVLTTATFVAQGRIPIELPKATQAQVLEEVEVLELHITAAGELYLRDSLVDLQALQEELLLHAGKSMPVRLRVDASAEFSDFVAVIDLLKGNGFSNVSIVTRQAGG